MTASHSHGSTSSSDNSDSSEYMDRVSALSTLLENEVEPLLKRIKRQYRGNVRGSSRHASLDDRLVPTQDQLELFASLDALRSLGSNVIVTAGASLKVWEDI